MPKSTRVVRKELRDIPDSHFSSHITSDVDFHRRPAVDLDLMIFQIGRKNKKKQRCIDLIVFLPFIIFVTLHMFFATHITAGYWINYALDDYFLGEEWPKSEEVHILKEFPDILRIDQYWSWLDFFMERTFNDEHFNGEELPERWIGYLMSQNKVVGALRFRQFRVVRNNPNCRTIQRYAPQLPEFDSQCYGAMGGTFPWFLVRANEVGTEPFPDESINPDWKGKEPLWTYKTCEELGGGHLYYGKFMNLGCGGFTEIMPFNQTKEEVEERVEFLKNNFWWDRYTRAIIHELFTYNQNMNYFTSVKAVVEFTNGGHVLTSFELKNFRLRHFRDVQDWIYFAFTLILPLYMIYFILRYFYDFYYILMYNRSHWYKHFLGFWNIIEVVILLLLLTSIVLRAISIFHPANNIDITKYEYPSELEEILLISRIDQAILAMFGTIAWLKSFRYFTFYDRLNLLSVTVRKAAVELLLVGVTLSILLTAFAFSGYVIFGYDMEEYKDIITSYTSLLRLLLGDAPDYIPLRDENRFLFPFHYVGFIVLGFLIVMNMFMAVLNDHFSAASKEVVDHELGYSPGSIFKKISHHGKRLLFKKSVPEEEVNLTSNSTQYFNQGDDEVIGRLKKFQDNQDISEFTVQHVETAIGEGSPPEIVKRLMDRFDEKGSGKITIQDIEKKRAQSLDLWKSAVRNVMIINTIADAGKKKGEEKVKKVDIDAKFLELQNKLRLVRSQIQSLLQGRTNNNNNNDNNNNNSENNNNDDNNNDNNNDIGNGDDSGGNNEENENLLQTS